MVAISQALSTGKTQHYYTQQYAAASMSYYSQERQQQGQWHGKLGKDMGLHGPVGELEFERLAAGKDPHTGEQIIQHRDTYLTKTGKESVHRAAWDITFHAPKTVSLTAVEDDRLRLAHRHAVHVTLDKMQEFAQARGGGDKPSITTGKWVVATFEHDTARPVGGYPAPHLHTHAVLFNMTHDGGQYRSLQTSELFAIQRYGTAVYQAELALALNRLGYERTPGTNGAPDIKGFTREYLDSESPRTQQIQQRLEELGLTGRRANEIIAHQDREKKLELTSDELRALHKAHAELYGSQAEKVIADAKQRSEIREANPLTPHRAVSHAIHSLSEREAVFEHWQVVTEALRYGQGHMGVHDVEANIEARRQLRDQFNPGRAKDLLEATHVREHAPSHRYTTPELLHLEAQVLSKVTLSQGAFDPLAPAIRPQDVREYRTPEGHPLNPNQIAAASGVLTSHEQITGIQGAAGAGKSSMLRFVKETAQANGYEVRGMAPTSGASQVLGDLDIKASTLQRHLIGDHNHEGKRLYFVDESSLMGTTQLLQFLDTLQKQDRAVLVGDTRQHQSIEAGRIFAVLQEAGMRTHQLSTIERQRENPQYLAIAKELAGGNITLAVEMLDATGRITEISHRAKRFEALAASYASDPQHSLIVSPDNRSRQEINQAVRSQLRTQGLLEEKEMSARILNPRQDLTTAQRKLSTAYEVGDVIKFGKAIPKHGIEKNEYITVIDRDYHSLTVQRKDGSYLTYDPGKISSKQIQVFTADQRQYSVGDRVQFTSVLHAKAISNRDLGTIESMDKDSILIKLDRTKNLVRISGTDLYHLDHGYAMTSYSSQGKTVDRVLVQIDTGDSKVRNLNDLMMAYVAMTRGKRELEVYTDSKTDLADTLNRAVLKTTAHSPEKIQSFGRTHAATHSRGEESAGRQDHELAPAGAERSN